VLLKSTNIFSRAGQYTSGEESGSEKSEYILRIVDIISWQGRPGFIGLCSGKYRDNESLRVHVNRTARR